MQVGRLPGVALLSGAAVQGDRRGAPAQRLGDEGVSHVLVVMVALQAKGGGSGAQPCEGLGDPVRRLSGAP
jgi:hypothetical protein